MRHTRTIAAMLASVSIASSLAAQSQCPDLPEVQPPVLKDCSKLYPGFLNSIKRLGCNADNSSSKDRHARMSRGFASGLAFTGGFFSRMDAEPRYVTTDSLRGCKGESVNLELTPGNVSYFEYELVSPGGVTVSANKYSTWTGDKILGENVILPESGYYTLRTRTTAPAVRNERKKKDGTVEYYTTYPRQFRVDFRTSAGLGDLTAGEKVTQTINDKQPLVRRVLVKGGTKVRFRFASQGTGYFLVTVRRESGEELYRNSAPTSFYESRAFTPRTDETFRLEVRPWYPAQAVGVEVSVLDDKATGEAVSLGSRVAGAFKLPANFTATASPSVATSEAVKLIYAAEHPERVTMTVKPSQLSGLSVRVRVYNEESEELALKPIVVRAPTALPLALTAAGTWIVELTPVAAPDLAEDGEAKYSVEFGAGAAGSRSSPPRSGQGQATGATRRP